MTNTNSLKENGIHPQCREDLYTPHADLEAWKKIHPRSSKQYPGFYVDFDDEGSRRGFHHSMSAIRELILERDKRRCRVCGSNCDHRVSQLEVQHIIPKKDGGGNHPKNLITLCSKCPLTTFKKGYGGIPRFDTKQTILKVT